MILALVVSHTSLTSANAGTVTSAAKGQTEPRQPSYVHETPLVGSWPTHGDAVGNANARAGPEPWRWGDLAGGLEAALG